MAFFRCTNLESIDFGNTVMNVYESAFMGCTSLTELYVPDQLLGLDSFVFAECSSLKKVRLSPNAEGLSSSLFTKCTSLDDIELPETIVNYGANCLSYTGLKEITFGPDVYEIGYAALQGCPELEKIVIPNLGNAYIAEDLAKDCPKLKEVIIPDNIVLINYHAFENCTSLESISLGRDIVTINYHAFYNCPAMTSFTIATKPAPILQEEVFDEEFTANVPLYVPETAIESYKTKEFWRDFQNILAIPYKLVLNIADATVVEGDVLQLSVAVEPSGSDTSAIVWSSSDEAVATVDQSGKVTAVAPGEAVITVATAIESASCTVTVEKYDGISDCMASDTRARIFTINGCEVTGKTLAPGIYIKRQGTKATKVIVK